MQQMSFPGLGPAVHREVHNFFFALWPGDSTRAEIAAAADRLKREQAPSGRWINPHRYHLTVHYLGAYASLPPDLVARARQAGARVRASTFDLVLDAAGSFPNRDIPWWLGCNRVPDAMSDLGGDLADALRASGLAAPSRVRLVPHVTILRNADRALPTTPVAPIVWPVDELVLIDSLLGAKSAYTVIGRWKLAPNSRYSGV